MKDINIKFLGLGYNDFYQAYIEIYDLDNNLIYKGYTYNGKLIISLCKNKIYKLKAKSLNETMCVYLYNKDNYVFIFNRAKFNYSRIITFLLTDYYYNLPIEKGEIYVKSN